MKTSTIAKLGIAILAMMVVGGTASASGGSSYSNAELINVPNGDIDIWSGTFSADDWYKFDVNNGDRAYIDLQYWFTYYGGEMKLHDRYQGDIKAWVSSSGSQHTATSLTANPQPRIEVTAGSQFNYQFIAGRNL